MKNILLAIICLTIITIACVTQAETQIDAREKDHQTLRAMLTLIKQSVSSNNIDALAPILHTDFSITMVDQTQIKTLDALKKYFYKMFEAEGALLKSLEIDPEADMLTEFLSDNIAVNYGSSKDTYTLATGHKITLNSRWTGTFIKIGQDWKIKNLHVGVNIIDNPILKANKNVRFFWAGGGVTGGLLLGFILFRKRKTG